MELFSPDTLVPNILNKEQLSVAEGPKKFNAHYISRLEPNILNGVPSICSFPLIGGWEPHLHVFYLIRPIIIIKYIIFFKSWQYMEIFSYLSHTNAGMNLWPMDRWNGIYLNRRTKDSVWSIFRKIEPLKGGWRRSFSVF